MNVALTADVRTIDGNDEVPPERAVSTIDPAELRPLLELLYPTGLGGKRFIDCACNGGGYSLLASELGAYAFGFDVRTHWIDQARFLKEYFGRSDEQVRFELCDLFDVGTQIGGERFDICLFKGIFYHLPDPVTGLKLVADRVDELLILDTATAEGYDDGFLKLIFEASEPLMSGVHHLAWHPTGPMVLCKILEWLGFEATCVVYWRGDFPNRPRGRTRVVAARDAALLAPLAVPPTSEVLVPQAGDGLSGTFGLCARAHGAVEVRRVEFRVNGAGHDDTLIAVASRTMHGWISEWDTTGLPNGAYALTSLAIDASGRTQRSASVPITVQN